MSREKTKDHLLATDDPGQERRSKPFSDSYITPNYVPLSTMPTTVLVNELLDRVEQQRCSLIRAACILGVPVD